MDNRTGERGRPRLPENEAKKGFSTKLHPRAIAIAKACAKAAGIPMARWLEDAIVEKAVREGGGEPKP